MKILIIEDHEPFRNAVKDHLAMSPQGFEILEAPSGEMGIVMARREDVDVVLTDILLPGMNGIEVAERIKRSHPECKIIVLTMFDDPASKKTYKTTSVSAYVEKSEIYDKLLDVIDVCMRESNGTAQTIL